MMNAIKKHILIIPFLILFCGCEEKLNLYPLTTLSEGNFYQDLPQLQSAVDDVYRQMGILYDARGIPSLYGILFSDNGSVIAQLAGTPVDQPIDRHEIFSENSRIQNAWDDAYSAIYICNNAIHQIDITNIVIDENHKNRMISEALVVRSLSYFNLVRAYGAIPLITEQITPAESYNYLRESPELVYQQLITDLNFAKNNLPESYTGGDVGRVTRFSAAAILSKIYLTIGDNAAAQTELEFIINSGRYSLDANNDGTINVEDYYYLFAPETKNSKSSILEAQYMSGPNARNSDHQEAFSPYLDGFNHPLIEGTITRGNGINTPSDDLASEFEPGDPRKDITIVPGFTSRATGFYVDYPFTLKYFDPDWFNAGQNFEIIRYADILLMYAEVTGDITYLNMVRERVGMPNYGSAEYPSDLYPTVDLAIEHERRVELAMEMHRFFDLVRTGRVVEVMEGKVSSFNRERLLFPIPQYAIDVNPGLNQNPRY